MVVVHLEMWPGGVESAKYTLGVAKLSLLGVATTDRADEDIIRGERVYHCTLYKDTAFGGPATISAAKPSQVWRSGKVRGHLPGPRGIWDLLGGALKGVLGTRLQRYRLGLPNTLKLQEQLDDPLIDEQIARWLDRLEKPNLAAAVRRGDWRLVEKSDAGTD